MATGWVAEVEGVVGAWQVRAATAEDAVCGRRPEVVVAPGSEEEVAAVLAVAHERRLRVAPRGGGTKINWGAEPAGVDLVLSLERLNRLLEHSAGDLTAVAEAGTTLAAIQADVAGDRQFLALDAPLPARATLGGIVSTNCAGPLRRRYGGVRDQLLGLTLARADGKLAKAGGKVVKNVAGYDLMKLLTGAFGTLGVVTRCAFRLYPIPEASATVVTEVPDGGEPLRGALVATAGSALVPVAVALLAGSVREATGIDGAGPLLAARFATLATAVEAQTRELSELWRRHGLQPRRLDEATQSALWGAAGTALWERDEATALCKASTTVTAVPELLALVQARGGSLLAHALSGIGYLRLGGEPAPLASAIDDVRAGVAASGGSLVVLDAPEAVRQAVDLWGPTDAGALAMMRRIKEQFDPRGVCNPGRFVGGI